MEPILRSFTSLKTLPENVMWVSTAVAISGVVIALFHSAFFTCLLLLLGAGSFFVAHTLHSSPDLTGHVLKLKGQLSQLKGHLFSINQERAKLQREIRRLLTAGSEVERNVARLSVVTQQLETKEAEFNDLIKRYEATADALARVETRLDAGVSRLHHEISRLSG